MPLLWLCFAELQYSYKAVAFFMIKDNKRSEDNYFSNIKVAADFEDEYGWAL